MTNVGARTRNTGNEDWLPQEGLALGAVGNDDPFAPTTRVPIQNTVTHNGGVYAFLMTFRAPAGPGDFDTDWRMVRDGGGPWFGQTFARTISVSCETPVDNAEVSWDLNETVACSDHPTVHVHVHNVGTTTWRSWGNYQGYSLALAPGSTPLADPFHTFPPNLEVPPDGHYTFTVVFHAPPSPDQYPSAAPTTRTDTPTSGKSSNESHSTCNPDDAVVANEMLATEVGCGRPYPVHIRMRNTGLNTWTREAGYALGNSFGSLAFTPPTSRVQLPPNVSVLRSGEVDFDFLLTAPFDPSPFHQMSWRMVHGGNTAFFGNGVSKTVNVHCDTWPTSWTSGSLGCGDGSRVGNAPERERAAWQDRLGYGSSPSMATIRSARRGCDRSTSPSFGTEPQVRNRHGRVRPNGAALFNSSRRHSLGPIISVSIRCPMLGASAVMSNRDSCDRGRNANHHAKQASSLERRRRRGPTTFCSPSAAELALVRRPGRRHDSPLAPHVSRAPAAPSGSNLLRRAPGGRCSRPPAQRTCESGPRYFGARALRTAHMPAVQGLLLPWVPSPR
jgi:hypothetical protein